jgi:hypothetical protein
MTFETVEAFVRVSFEPLQYAAFFGVFAIFAALEAVAPRDPSPAMRVRRWPSNVVLTALNIVVLSTLPVGIVAAAEWAQGARFGLLHVIDVAAWAAFAIGFWGGRFVGRCIF